MTPEQLASARAAHWREDAQPILTLDDAKSWLERMQLCLYLPRKNHVMAPAPSFVGAVLGASSATPGPEAIQQADSLLVRLVVEGFAVPLNLFGTSGEQPDFLIVTTALPHLAALQPDRTWKKPPARTGPGKVSPLAIEIWKLLDREGALSATEIREQLGHELTEAATIRGLSELWQNLRVAPLPQGDTEPALWEILAVTHKKEMAAGSTMAQSTALSLLVSYYVQSVLVATAEDVEAFLSPVASRSRLRDVIRGLSATRQLKTLSMDAQTFLFIEGTLPEVTEVADAGAAEAKPAFMGRSAYRERMLNKGKEEDEGKAEDTSPRTYKDRRGDAGTASESARPRRAASSDRGSRTPGPPRRDAGSSSRPSRFGAGGASRPARPSFGDRARSGPGSSGSRPPFRKPESDAAGERPRSPRPFTLRSGTGRPGFGGASSRPSSFRPRPAGDRPSDSGERKPFAPRPFTPRSEGRDSSSRPPFRGKPSEGGSQPFRARTDGERPRSGSSDRPRSPRTGDSRPFTPRPFAPREGSSRPPFRGKSSDGGARPFRPRTDGERPRSGSSDRPRSPRTGDSRPFTPRPSSDRSAGGRDGSSRPPFRGKSSEGGARPFRPRTDGDRPRPDRPRTSGSFDRPRPSGGRPTGGAGRPSGSFTKRNGPPSSGGRSTGRPPARPGTPGRNPGGTGRPGGPKFGSTRPGGARPGAPRPGGARPGGARPGGASRPGNAAKPRSASKPGGMRPPTRKPRKESDSE